MPVKDPYLFDSSIWIDIERQKESVISQATPLILKNRVCICDLIIAELLRGTRTDADFAGLQLRLASFPVYTADWQSIARLAHKVAKAGYNPPLTDLYIADCAIQHKKTLVTADKHFKEIYKVYKFKLEFWG